MDRKSYDRAWYAKNKERISKRKLAIAGKRRNFLKRVRDEIKVILGCKSCGYSEHPAALQFHHRDPQTKLFNLGDAAGMAIGLKKFLAEANKCDVMCANCHAIWESASGKLRASEA